MCKIFIFQCYVKFIIASTICEISQILKYPHAFLLVFLKPLYFNARGRSTQLKHVVSIVSDANTYVSVGVMYRNGIKSAKLETLFI